MKPGSEAGTTYSATRRGRFAGGLPPADRRRTSPNDDPENLRPGRLSSPAPGPQFSPRTLPETPNEIKTYFVRFSHDSEQPSGALPLP